MTVIEEKSEVKVEDKAEATVEKKVVDEGQNKINKMSDKEKIELLFSEINYLKNKISVLENRVKKSKRSPRAFG